MITKLLIIKSLFLPLISNYSSLVLVVGNDIVGITSVAKCPTFKLTFDKLHSLSNRWDRVASAAQREMMNAHCFCMKFTTYFLRIQKNLTKIYLKTKARLTLLGRVAGSGLSSLGTWLDKPGNLV